uniref:Uncharacterized protein n=1 Tax=Tetraselmis sp. GSL018 TaxID=582737 RepID=A0A061R5J1_9CHLO
MDEELRRILVTLAGVGCFVAVFLATVSIVNTALALLESSGLTVALIHS